MDTFETASQRQKLSDAKIAFEAEALQQFQISLWSFLSLIGA